MQASFVCRQTIIIPNRPKLRRYECGRTTTAPSPGLQQWGGLDSKRSRLGMDMGRVSLPTRGRIWGV